MRKHGEHVREEGLWVFSLAFSFLAGCAPRLEKAQLMTSLKAITGANEFFCGTCQGRQHPLPLPPHPGCKHKAALL